MEALLGAFEHSTLATTLRASRWAYAGLSATHILGIALLVGGILPLDLRLLGAWPTIARRDVARVLVRTAAAGLALAMITGILLFSVRATEYASLPIFWAKMALIATGALSALLAHRRHGIWLDRGHRLARLGLASSACWLATLLTGRLIAFM